MKPNNDKPLTAEQQRAKIHQIKERELAEIAKAEEIKRKIQDMRKGNKK